MPALGRRIALLVTALTLAVTGLIVSPQPASAATWTAEQMEALMLSRMNSDRVNRGLVPYRNWGALATLANDRAQRMATVDKLSHEAAGGDIGRALDSRGIQWFGFGETIGVTTYAWGSDAALNIYGLWKGSAPHRAIMFSSTYNYAGVGVVLGRGGKIWISAVFTESKDHTAPIAKNGALTVSGTTVGFSWRGSDPRLQTHTAGLRSFDVQYRVDGGTWRTIRNDTTSTSLKLYNRTPGHVYSLRVQAADRRGTLSKWTSEQTIRIP